MPLEFRPTTHAERDEVIAAIEAYLAGDSPDAVVVALDERIFSAARSEYTEARLNYQNATSASRDASDAADRGDNEFDRDFRQWTRTVNDAGGKSLSGQLSKFMGGTKPGKLVNLPYRKELNKVSSLFKLLPDNPELQGEPDKLAALKVTVAEFEPLVSADEAATRTKVAKGRVSIEATDTFDKAYVKFARAVVNVLGEEAAFAILPRFERASRGGGEGGEGGGSEGGGGGEPPA